MCHRRQRSVGRECCGTKIGWAFLLLCLRLPLLSLSGEELVKRIFNELSQNTGLKTVFFPVSYIPNRFNFTTDQISALATFFALIPPPHVSDAGEDWDKASVFQNPPKWVISVRSKEGFHPRIVSLEYQTADGSLLMPSKEQKKIPECSVGARGEFQRNHSTRAVC